MLGRIGRAADNVSATSSEIRHVAAEILDGVHFRLVVDPVGVRQLIANLVNGDEPVELPVSVRVDIKEEGE